MLMERIRELLEKD